ncbi:hypothetical protein ACHAXA_009120 [Cyclostephanos tholiformis]|uniref:Uncharacterized protein n=1 Tax=Cyclostephanos tholiformis TaxID=382380 RepID=A0ABD3RXL0_9STRA
MRAHITGAIACILATFTVTNGFAAKAPVLHNVVNDVIGPQSSGYRPSCKVESGRSTLRMSTHVAATNDKALSTFCFDIYTKTANAATIFFPLWTVLFTAIAIKRPSTFDFFTTEHFTAALSALMLSMGITLTPADIVAVVSEPSSILMQFSLCYGMMPILAMVLGKAFGLDAGLLAGIVLVGSMNGGQASNLCTYIAKGNVALSVLMTTATTVGAILMTPFLCKTILGAVVPIDAKGIAVSTCQVVLAPVAVGMTLNKFFPNVVKMMLPFAPVVGVVSTCLLVASAVAQVVDLILNAGMGLQVSVLLLHLVGGIVGYWLPKVAGFGEVKSRTMAIETSTKSSGFGFLLAKLHFGDYAARVPSAVSIVWLALTVSLLSVFWRYMPVREAE